MANIQAIETLYAGVKFRSRLEARWAIFFDAIGIHWQYEPEGFQLEDEVRYLPDFYLEKIGYFEVKPFAPSDDEMEKARLLEAASGKRVYVAAGPIPEPDRHPNFFVDENQSIHVPGDFGYAWCECSSCGRLGIQFNGEQDRLDCACPPGRHASADAERLGTAYRGARTERFWEPASRRPPVVVVASDPPRLIQFESPWTPQDMKAKLVDRTESRPDLPGHEERLQLIAFIDASGPDLTAQAYRAELNRLHKLRVTDTKTSEVIR